MCRKSSCCHASQKSPCFLPPLLVGIALGGIYGMLFAKTSGDDLRKKLRRSKTPLKDFFLAGMEMDFSFLEWVKKEIEKKLK